MLFFMALVCFSQAWLFSTELNSCSPCHLGPSHGGPSHATRRTGTSDTLFLLILFQVLASTGPPAGLHSYIPFHPSAVVQKRRLPPFCGGGDGEMFEYDACKSRSSEGRTGASQPRASKAGEADREEEAGYMMLWALAPRGAAPRGAVQNQKAVRSKKTQPQEKNIPHF